MSARFGTCWRSALSSRSSALLVGYHFRPFSLSRSTGALAGFLFAIAVILLRSAPAEGKPSPADWRRHRLDPGDSGRLPDSLIFTHTTMPESTRSFFSLAIFLVMTYIGLVLGANKGDMLNLQAFGGVFGSERNTEAFVQSCSIPA